MLELARPVATACPQCATQVASGLLTCPACHRLVHTSKLTELAQQAEAAEQSGDHAGAIGAWQEALTLLPPRSHQHQAVAARLSSLGEAQVASDARQVEASIGGRSWKWLSGFGAIGLLVWKLKFVFVFLLTKGKLLLFGLTKGPTALSMLASFGAYWAQWGMWFAAGLVLSIYVHEMGHVAALRRYGIAASAPMFIPGLGAFIRAHHAPPTPAADARVGLAGPVWGLGAALAAGAVFAATGHTIWAAIAHTGAWINLFNLLPVWQLDGNRGFAALAPAQRWFAAAILSAAWLATGEGLLALIAIAACVRAFSASAPATADRGALALYAFLVVALSLLCVSLPRA